MLMRSPINAGALVYGRFDDGASVGCIWHGRLSGMLNGALENVVIVTVPAADPAALAVIRATVEPAVRSLLQGRS